MPKKRYIRFTLFEDGTKWGSCLMPADDTSWLQHEMEESPPGQTFLVEIVEMTEEEYAALPEFDGF